MPSAAVFKTCLDVLYYSGASTILRHVFAGTGAIFMLHHVYPGGGLQRGFAPNAGIELTPEFLDEVIAQVKSSGFDLVTLAEAVRRMTLATPEPKPFAVFTLDDGYRDNLVHAKPVFDRHQCPYTIFVAPSIIDGTCLLWWRGLEQSIAAVDRIDTVIGGRRFSLAASTPQQKQQAWDAMYWPIRHLEQHQQRQWIAGFCASHGAVDLTKICTGAAMTWDELRTIAADPLCTIGAHTINHYAVAQLSEAEALDEMARSADRLERELGRRPEFFAYPYGDEESAGPRDFRLAEKAGFAASITTRKGMIYPGHGAHLQALPRVSLSGSYQQLRFVKTLLTGAPFMLFNGLKSVNVT